MRESIIVPCGDCGADVDASPEWLAMLKHDGNPPRCCDCHNRKVAEIRDARTAELAALPRCEAPAGCRRRGTILVGVDAGRRLCGHHKQRAERVLAAGVKGPLAGLALFSGVGSRMTGDDVVALLAPSDQGRLL